MLQLAHAKAAAIADKLRLEAAVVGAACAPAPHVDGLLVTCDQVVVHEGNILEKPEDEAQAG